MGHYVVYLTLMFDFVPQICLNAKPCSTFNVSEKHLLCFYCLYMSAVTWQDLTSPVQDAILLVNFHETEVILAVRLSLKLISQEYKTTSRVVDLFMSICHRINRGLLLVSWRLLFLIDRSIAHPQLICLYHLLLI